jgi:hypothetical protein
MAPTIFVFSRNVPASRRTYRQSVAVYADDAAAATKVLSDTLKQWLREPGHPPSDVEVAYQTNDGWQMQTVELDRPKIVAAVLAP